jgi:hypothetical protein
MSKLSYNQLKLQAIFYLSTKKAPQNWRADKNYADLLVRAR